MNFYSDNNPHAAAWIEELIAAGQIADGVVDDRDVQLLGPEDNLGQYDQVHLFCGIAGWPYALDLAGWPIPVTPAGGRTSRSGDRKNELLVGGIVRTMPDPGPRVAFPPLVTQHTDDLNDTSEARTMRLKGYGNAIVPPLAAEFIRTVMEVIENG